MEKQMVIFELNEEYYGVDISMVESIIKIQPVTRIPYAPFFVEGLIHLRGRILPVIDLRKRFDLPPLANNKDSRIAVISMNNGEVGMIVDNVSEVQMIQDTDIELAPNMVTRVDTSYLTGIAKLDGRLIMLLDLSAVFSVQDPNLAVLPALN